MRVDDAVIVKAHYDAAPQKEWDRLAGGKFELKLALHFMEKYIKPGESVLDIGGGPGRYSLWLAERGAQVTLFDLSPGNTRFALERAAEQGIALAAVTGDARETDKLVSGQFEHVLLMGPMYHLLDEKDRVRAVEASLNLLKPGGMLYASFISMVAGIIYGMKFAPEIVASVDPFEDEYIRKFIERKSYGGEAFTKAFFIEQGEIMPFMARFPLEKICLFGQESISSPCEDKIMSQPKEIVDLWLDLFEKVCEREDLLGWSEHLMYIGRKIR
jgi:2-polyprenyl-3-methyl-5-hydroxy-6-metoxy-1,4-benzoquinol methylase